MKGLKLGWIGLGHMGVPMAQNLIGGGFDLSVYNRTEEKTKPLTEKGATLKKNVLDLCRDSDIIFVMLSDDFAVSSIFASILETDISGKFFVNMSTISPSLSIELSQKIVDKKARYLEAPVSGSVKPAQDATLIVLAGGKETDYYEVLPYFEKLSKLSLLIGDVGQGAKAKLAINYYMSVMIEGLAETVLFAEENGISRETMMLIVNESACSSPMSKMKTASILRNEYLAAFPLKHMYKDIGLARSQGLNSVLAKSTFDIYKKAMDEGFGDEDLMAVIKAMMKL